MIQEQLNSANVKCQYVILIFYYFPCSRYFSHKGYPSLRASSPVSKGVREGRGEGRSHGWENNRCALLQYILKCEKSARTSAHKGTTGSCPHSVYELTQPMRWMMWCLKFGHTTGVYVPYSFQTVRWVLFTSHKNQISVRPVSNDVLLPC